MMPCLELALDWQRSNVTVKYCEVSSRAAGCFGLCHLLLVLVSRMHEPSRAGGERLLCSRDAVNSVSSGVVWIKHLLLRCCMAHLLNSVLTPVRALPARLSLWSKFEPEKLACMELSSTADDPGNCLEALLKLKEFSVNFG